MTRETATGIGGGVKPSQPCDKCSKYKSKCVLPFAGSETCKLCEVKNLKCVFTPRVPKKRNRRTRQQILEAKRLEDLQKQAQANEGLLPIATTTPVSTNPSTNTSVSISAPPEDHNVVTSSADKNTIETISAATDWIPDNINLNELSLNFVNEEFSGWNPVFLYANGSNNLGMPCNPNRIDTPTAAEDTSNYRHVVLIEDYDWLMESSLHKTLGLQCNRYLSYIGASGELDSLLMSHYNFRDINSISLTSFVTNKDSGAASNRHIKTIRQIFKSESSANSRIPGTTESFLMIEEPMIGEDSILNRNRKVQVNPRTVGQIEEVQELVGGTGSRLLQLFLKHVLCCYPMMHKTTLMDKANRSIFELTPSILSVMYAFATNWWSYDTELSANFSIPPRDVLEKKCQKFFHEEISKPTISTIQAGMLLLHHKLLTWDPSKQDDTWVLLVELYGGAQEIGLHLDSTKWDIPRWEVSLRKRLAWALYIQDKWFALTCGRGSLIHESNWNVSDLNIETDFMDLFNEHPGELNTESTIVSPFTGTLMYVEMTKLTKIVSEILNELYTVKNTTAEMDFQNYDLVNRHISELLETVKSLHIKLKQWYQNVPSCLRIDAQKKELSSNCNLYMAFYSAEIALFRPLIKVLALTNSSDFLEIKKYVYQATFDLFTAAVDLIGDLSIRNLQTFWYSFTKNNLAIVATFAFLIFMSVEDIHTKRKCLSKIEEYRWSLVFNSKVAPFMNHAVALIDHYYIKFESQIAQAKRV